MHKIAIMLSQRQYEHAHAESMRLGVSMSDVIRRMLDEVLDRKTSFKEQMAELGIKAPEHKPVTPKVVEPLPELSAEQKAEMLAELRAERK